MLSVFSVGVETSILLIVLPKARLLADAPEGIFPHPDWLGRLSSDFHRNGLLHGMEKYPTESLSSFTGTFIFKSTMPVYPRQNLAH